tara:strand:+ start:803 stop:1312 length:510 start_codon:yes stop_codon:yes gene_type:complete
MRGTVFQINQIYIQLAIKGVGHCLFTYPSILDLDDKWQEDIDGAVIGDITHSERYQDVRYKNETLVNFLDKDFKTETQDITSVSIPLRTDKAFYGAMLYELEPIVTLNSSALSQSFLEANTNFLQIFHPLTITESGQGRKLLELEKHKDNQFNISTDPRHVSKIIELQK